MMKMNKKKHILITGGLGNLGLWLSEFFLNESYKVTVLSRKESYSISNPNYNFLKVDIENIKSIQNNTNNQYYDYCIHAASVNDSFIDDYARKALLVNALGTRNLCEALSENRVGKLLYLSTYHVYGATDGIVNEETNCNPISDYALTHLFGEKYIELFASTKGLKYTIIRLSNSYGAPKTINSSKWYLILNDLSKQAFVNQKIILKSNGKASRDFISMQTVCEVLEQVLKEDNCNNKIFNLSAEQSYTMLKIAEYVQDAYYKRYNKKIPIEINNLDTSKQVKLKVSSEKLRKIISFKAAESFELEINKIFDLLENTKYEVKK